jgi:hypothetical protein
MKGWFLAVRSITPFACGRNSDVFFDENMLQNNGPASGFNALPDLTAVNLLWRPKMATYSIDLTQEYLKSALDYDRATGVFTWRKRSDMPRKWNAKHSGKLAGCVDDLGYIKISLRNKRYRGHRLAWLYIHGAWPKDLIDHINTDRSDNRIVNLREATKSQNAVNSRRPSNNTSGFKGVVYSKQHQKWIAQTAVGGKHIHLGLFDDAENAHVRYCDEMLTRHGQFARNK